MPLLNKQVFAPALKNELFVNCRNGKFDTFQIRSSALPFPVIACTRYLTFVICVGGISIMGRFHEFLEFNFWRVFDVWPNCELRRAVLVCIERDLLYGTYVLRTSPALVSQYYSSTTTTGNALHSLHD